MRNELNKYILFNKDNTLNKTLLKKYFHPNGYKILDEKYEDPKINQNCNNFSKLVMTNFNFN